jgi:hypothetical protein
LVGARIGSSKNGSTAERTAKLAVCKISHNRVAFNGMLDDQQATLGGFKQSGVNQKFSISANEAADRLAIWELVDPYAYCADRRIICPPPANSTEQVVSSRLLK